MIQGKWFASGSDISEPLSIREVVFGRGRDALDDLSQQTVVYNSEGVAVGTARLWWQNGAFVIGDIGVLPHMRNKGYGDLLVRLCLFKALTHNATRIELTAPSDVSTYFAKYGFQPTPMSGKDTVHMAIRADDVHLSHCGGHCEACPDGACSDRK